MEGKTAIIIGATGLIGSNVVQILQHDEHFETVKVVVRRPVSFDSQTKVIVIDFSDEIAFKSAIAGSDAVFCAVGTTTKKVKGNKDAYRKADYDIPVNAARFCAETGCANFLLVSSVGANSKSKNFYLKLKGEVEDAVRKMNIRSVSVFRPSMLLGKRQEFRFGEKIVQPLIKTFSFLLPSKYKPITALIVAKAMVSASKQDISGFQIYHYKKILQLDAQQ